MEWITSEGGPLIIIGRKSLADWQGIESNEYDRACAVDDYAGVINVSTSQALVLGDEPCQTAIYHSKSLGVLIVRWQWAKSESSVQNIVECLTAEDFKKAEEETDYRVDDSSLLLFDSVSAGDGVTGMSLSLPEATYRVATICYAPDDDTSLILHRFIVKT
jgi:hypothetical protein